jgi:hypothetical protein
LNSFEEAGQNMMLIFYDREGNPTVYTINGEDLYLFSGEPVAYFLQDAVYSFSGKQLGWLWDGWIRDLNGYCVFYTPYAVGGVLKPLMKLTPLASLRGLKPSKAPKESLGVRPSKKNTWSNFSKETFFQR